MKFDQTGRWQKESGGLRGMAYKNLNKIHNRDVASVKGRATDWNRSQSSPC